MEYYQNCLVFIVIKSVSDVLAESAAATLHWALWHCTKLCHISAVVTGTACPVMMMMMCNDLMCT